MMQLVELQNNNYIRLRREGEPWEQKKMNLLLRRNLLKTCLGQVR